MKNNKKQTSYYIREYTLRNKSTKSIKVEPWRSFKEEMRVLGITDNDIFQIQLIKNIYNFSIQNS
ncbi:hypothetical protein [Bacillus thuringiensis]|uniref:hypothetical protein n=1 Tax=Bacillus thuringiensis TaxID=1428 RepID=UPI000BFD82D9|nr:hypothetical protein [Bacillus thuringiensis]PGM25101.1 hypothetical protein CN932_18720 [Bacillus thuringiensis]